MSNFFFRFAMMAAGAMIAARVPAQTIQVAFGNTASTTLPTGNWNHAKNNTTTPNGSVANLIDFGTGSTTGVALSSAGWFNGFSIGASGGAGWATAASFGNNWYTNNATGTLTLTGLTGAAYQVNLTSYFAGAGGYWSDMRVNGNLANSRLSGSTFLTSFSSNTDYLIWNSVAPVSGTITITVAPGTSAAGGMINALRLTSPVVVASATVSGPSAGSYRATQPLDFTAAFPVAIAVVGSPSIALTVGGTARSATYVSGTGTTSLVFRYVVQTGETDADGVALAGSFTLPGGASMRDPDGVAVAGTFTAPTTTAVLVDTTSPTVSSSARLTPATSPTAASSLTYRVTFSEAVVGVDTSDFSLTTTGSVTATIASVTGSGAAYDVTLTGVTAPAFAGTVRLDVKSTGTGIADAAGNALSGGFAAGETYTLDTLAPSVSSLNVQTPATVVTSATAVTWRVTFSEPVTGVDSTDFSLRADSVPTATIGTVTAVSTTVFDVNVTGIAGEGLLALILNSSGTGITDAAGGAIATGFLSGQSYTIDRTGPTLNAIVRLTPSSPTTGAASVIYRVTFNEAVAGVNAGDFTLTTTGATAGTVASVSAASGTVIDVTVSGVSGAGTLRLDLNATGTGIADLAGNAIAGGGFTTGEAYTITAGVSIATHPVTQTAAAGSTVTLSVTAGGAAPFTYQWYRDGAAVSGATNDTLAFAAVALSDAANYSVLVSNSSGAALSNVATLTVAAAPSVATLSAISGRVVEFGASATLTSLFTGSGTLTYQWSKDGTPLSGQTNAAYTLASAAATDAGDYTVTATNSLGAVTSSTIAVTIASVGTGSGPIRVATNGGTQVTGNVDATTGVLNGTATTGAAVAPTIPGIATIADLLLELGSTGTLTTVASGNPAPTYQWSKNGTPLAGATNATLTLAAAAATDAGTYTVTATNSGGAVTSAALGVTVGHVASSGPVSFSTSGGTRIAAEIDATSGALTGSVTTSGGATAAPFVDGISAKSGLLLNQGASATLAVAASGNPVPTYQWLKNNVAVAGATNATFSLTNAQPTDAATYTVRATNAGGTVTATGVPVTVVQLPGGATGSVTISGGNGTQVAGTIDSSGVLTGGVTSGGPNAVVAPLLAGVNTAADLLLGPGSSVTLTSVATGHPAPTYQWLKNNVVLSGATASNLTLASVTAADAGNYTVRATNTGGTVTSLSLGVTVGQTSTGGPISFATSGGTQIAGQVDATSGVLTGSVTASGGAAVLPVIDGITAKSGLLLNQGAGATLAITASGNPAPTYQWLKNGNVIAGATTANFTLTNAQPADAATYSARATNAGGTVTSAGVGVTVVNLSSGSGPVTISGGNGTQVSGTIDSSGILTGSSTAGGPDAVVAPLIAGINTAADLLVTTGTSATLSALATGSPTPTFQWTRNGTTIAGATGATYTIAAATAADSGTYVVRATNASGTATSTTLGVTVGQFASGGGPLALATSGGTQISGKVDGPTGALTGTVTATGGAAAIPTVDGISAQTGILLNQGSSASLRVSASGLPVPTYQWLRDGNAIAGATNSSFSLVNAQPTDAGSYTVRATNAAGTTTSAGVPVTVINLSGTSGPVTIAGGNGTVVSGAIDATGVLTGGVTSGGVNAAVAPKLGGIDTRADLLVELGATATLAAVATGQPAPTFQWFKDGSAVAGATSSSYVLASATAAHAGNYTLRATNSAGTVTSASLGVTVGQIASGGGPIAFSTSGGTEIAGRVDASTGVLTGSVTATGGANAAPVIDGITAQSGVMLNQGATATLSIAASGNPAPTYQWLKDGTALTGATNATLTLTNAQPADAATYAVRATNAAGTVTGAGLPVTVIQLPSGTAGPLTLAGGNGTHVSGTIDSAGVLTGGVTTGGSGAQVAPIIGGVKTSADLLVETGTAATLEAVATGSPAPAFQWFRNGTALSGATQSRYTLATASSADAGSYTVTATNSAGIVTSTTLGVTVARIASGGGPVDFATSGGTQIAGHLDGPSGVLTGSVSVTGGAAAAPAINGITAKSGVMLNQGSGLTFSATASGNPVPTYQWLKDGVALAGQTRSSFTLTNAQPTDAGNYTVLATNTGGSATSAGVPVTVFALGNNGSVSISGGNGTQVSGAIDSSGLLTGGLTTGGPNAIVAPRVGGVNNLGATVASVGQSLALTVVATGNPAPAYQWYREGVALAGATTATLNLANVRLVDAGNYAVIATNASGQAGSSAVNVQVVGANPPLAPRVVSVGTTPGNLLLDRGTGLTLTAAVTANPLPAYQWLKDGVEIPLQTGASLTIASAQSADAGRYSLRATNPQGTTTSQPVAVSVALLATVGAIEIATEGGTLIKGTVDGATGALTGSVTTGGVAQVAAPRIVGVSSNPGSIAAEVGSTATLSVAASGQPAPAIQWLKDGVALPGQTAAKLTFVNLQPADAGNYTARLTNSGGTATTGNLELTVYGTTINGQLSVTTNTGVRVAGTVDPATGLFAGTTGTGPSTPTTPTIPTTPTTPALVSQLSNLSARATLRSGETVTAGFVIAGTESRRLLIRAVGPGLAQFGVSDVLARPLLRVLRGAELVGANAGLAQATNLTDILIATRDLGAFALDGGGVDAAVLVTLPAGAYSAEVTGLAGAGGQLLLEVYDAEPARVPSTRLSNFSSRLNLTAGETITFGASIAGPASKRVLIRAIGPTLTAAFGVTPAVTAPSLRVLQGSAVIAQNTRWGLSADAAAIATAAAAVGAFALNPTSGDSVAIVTLAPGSYSVQIDDAARGSGSVLVEFYELP